MEYYSFSCVIILNQITMLSMMSRHILAPCNTYWLGSSAPGGNPVLLLDTKFFSRAFPVTGQGVPYHAAPRLGHLRSEPKLRFKVVEKEWDWTFYVKRPRRCPSVTGVKKEPQVITAPCLWPPPPSWWLHREALVQVVVLQKPWASSAVH